jgi:hypothetical protein
MPTLQETSLITSKKCVDIKGLKNNLNINTFTTIEISL